MTWENYDIAFFGNNTIWASSESIFEYFHMAMMASCPIAFFGNIWYGYHLKAFFEYFHMAMMASCPIALFGNIWYGYHQKAFLEYFHMPIMPSHSYCLCWSWYPKDGILLFKAHLQYLSCGKLRDGYWENSWSKSARYDEGNKWILFVLCGTEANRWECMCDDMCL